jgi:CubicO group peptidase (beta-lactamase class C family)
MPPADVNDRWTDRLADLAPQCHVMGAALGIWADGQEVIAAHGVLSTATQVPVTADSVFQVGSITKVWTGSMIMQLAEEGRLSLDAPVAEFLPGVRLGSRDVSADVTVRHLLTHTSGVDGDIFNDTGRGGDCVERYVSELAQAALTHPAGQAYSYCNSGFVLLGRIIEVLDGREWDGSLRARLVEPLGLHQTVTLPEEAILHRAAVGHRARPHETDPVSEWMLPRSVGPAGLITSSVHDVLTFARMHLDRGVARDGTRVLSEDTVAAMQVPQFEIPSVGEQTDAIGLAWRLRRWGERMTIGHDGSTIGQNAFLRADPHAQVAVCLLTNAADGESLFKRVFTEVLGEYAGIAPPAEPEPVAGPVAGDISRHAGRYERSSRIIDVSVRAGRLHVTATETGQLADMIGDEPEELDLHPADQTGDNFVCRMHDDEPWSTVSFGRLADQTPYVFASGRITLRAG